MKLKSLLLIAGLSFLTSCSSYMNTLYRDFEQQERANDEVDVSQTDSFDQFRHKRRTSSQYNQGGKVDRTITTSNMKNISPEIKRQYKPEKEVNRRITASDLTDNGNDGSLWAGSDPNAFLFSSVKTKTSGDIVQINVLPKLKNEITMELKRAFPDNPYDNQAVGEKGADAAKAPEKKDAVAETGNDGGQDKISGVIVEEINREHLLIKGRKNVLYKNRKRMVEVQALVSRKDVTDSDIVNSDAIIESSISVVR